MTNNLQLIRFHVAPSWERELTWEESIKKIVLEILRLDTNFTWIRYWVFFIQKKQEWVYSVKLWCEKQWWLFIEAIVHIANWTVQNIEKILCTSYYWEDWQCWISEKWEPCQFVEKWFLVAKQE